MYFRGIYTVHVNVLAEDAMILDILRYLTIFTLIKIL